MEPMLRLQLTAGLSSFVTLASVAFVLTAEPGCSASVEADQSGSATTGASGGSGGALAVATSVTGAGGGVGGSGTGGSEPSACVPFDGAVLAVDKLYLGGRTFDDMDSPIAWKDFGFDLDAQSTSSDFSKHCTPAPGGSTSAFGDGTDGRDNSFGRNVRPILEGLVPSLDGQANDAISAGQFSEIFAFAGLGSGADAAALVTKVYGAGSLGLAPSWKGGDCWPVLHSELSDPSDISTAKTSFPTSKLVKNVWDSNGTSDLVLTLNVAGQSVPITIYGARATVQLAATHQGGALGHIGGYLKTEEFIKTLRAASGAINPAACTIFDASLAAQLRRTSDLLDDGSQDPTKTCNAISVGFGFSLRKVAFGAISPKGAEPIDYCK